MKIILVTVSIAALVMLIVSPVLVYAGRIDLDLSKNLMFGATVVWFGTSPFWMRKRPS